MKYSVDNKEYDVLIERKNNKNTYIKIKNNGIVVTTNYLVSDRKIIKLLDSNISFLRKALRMEEYKREKDDNFYYFGKKYDIIITPLYDVEFINDKVYTKSLDSLDKYLRKNMKEIYKERVDFYYKQFVENIPYPIIKFRTMKTRWGVCNRSNNSITLNNELIKYDIGCLNYVIVHELSHFVHFDHSKEFWTTVEKYYPEYKKYRDMLKN